MSKPTLLPCAHCGQPATAFETTKPGDVGRVWCACCNSCQIGTARCYSENEAIAAWNRRTPTPSPAVRALVEALVEAAKDVLTLSSTAMCAAEKYRAMRKAIAAVEREQAEAEGVRT